MDELIEYLKNYIEPMIDKIYDELSSIHVTLKSTRPLLLDQKSIIKNIRRLFWSPSRVAER